MKRKIVNKLLAICLSISMIAGTGLPVTAAGTENTPQTTVTTEATTEKTTSSTSTLYKVKLTLPGITAATSVKSLSVKQNGKDYTYDYKDLKTDDKGVLYLKLPANAKGQTTSITVNDVSFSGTVNANDDNAFAAPPAKTESEKTTEKATEKATEKTTASSETETAKGTEAATEPTESTEKKSPETEPVTDTKATEDSKVPDTEAPTTESQKATETTGQTDSNKTTPGESETTDTNGSHKASAVDNIKIDYANETLTNVTSDMEYSVDNKVSWKNCVADGQGMKITDEMLNKSVWIKLKTEADGKEFKIPGIDNAPNVTPGNASAKDKTDGTLTVTNPGSSVYEYRIKGGTWADMTAGKATGLAAGSYEVRVKATNAAFASKIAAATVSVSVNAKAELSIAKPVFSEKSYGYKATSLNISVKNTGDADAVVADITLSGASKDAFEIINKSSNLTVPAKTTTGKVLGAVQIKTGLDTGIYNASVVVAYNNGQTATTEVSLTVNKMKVTPSIDSVESKTYDKSKDAKGKLKLTPPSGYSFGNDEPTATGKFVFDSADAGTKKAVSVSDIKLGSGFDKNYVLSSTSIKNKTTSAKISKAKNTKKPEDVKVSSFTYNSITMKTASGVEYSIDDGDNWTSTGSFKSLKEKTSYKILARYKESTNYEASKSVSVEQTTLRNPIISNPQNNKVTGVQTTTSYKTGSTLTFTATGAGSEIKSPSQSPSLDDVRYIPVSWTSYVNGTWDNNASSNSGSFKLNSSGSYTLSVSFQKQKYDGTNWVNETSTKDTKSVSYKVVTSTTTSSTNKNTTNKTGVKTGDVNPIMLMVILLVVSGTVIVVLVVRTRSKRRQHRE